MRHFRLRLTQWERHWLALSATVSIVLLVAQVAVKGL